MSFNDIELYAGIADARLQVDAFHFGHGIALRIFESGWVPTLREMETGHLGPH